ncbi:MAG: glycosyltransferase family 2 protein [Thiohalomonadales bacterium]
MDKYTVSVIIPTYNRADLLPRAIDSVLAQTLPASQVIVINDGSNDDTANIMRTKYQSIEHIRTTQNGVSAARNRGIAQAQGEWIALLDSDDEWSPQKLQRQIEALREQPSYKVCHSDEIWMRHGVRVNPMHKHRKKGGHIYAHCLPLCAMSPSTVLIHRSVLEQVGVFDHELPACEDYDLWLRICAFYPVLYLHEKLVTRYAGHNDQLSLQYWGMDRFRIKALLKMLNNTQLEADDRQLTLEIFTKKCNILIKGGIKRDNSELVEYYRQLINTIQ